MCPAYTKEIEFFDKHFDNGFTWYEQQFNDGLTGEATPTYIWNPKAPQRVFAYKPDMKIIILKRDRSESIKSKYWQQISKGVEKLSFEDALEYEDIRIAGELSRTASLPYNHYPTLYSEFAYKDRFDGRHIERWSKFGFSILIVYNFFSDTDTAMHDVFKFIGLPLESHRWEIMNKGIDYPK